MSGNLHAGSAGHELAKEELDAAENFERMLRAGGDSTRSSALVETRDAEVIRLLNAVFQSPLTLSNEPIEDFTHRTFGRFEIQSEIGFGSFGRVFLARDTVLKRDVALKIPYADGAQSAEATRRLIRERQAAAKLSHPQIVPLFDAGDIAGRIYLVSEYCNGPNLEQWLEARGEPLDQRQAAQLVRELAAAVQHAHDRKILHRDIKPSNILMEASEVAESGFSPRLTDFGLARDGECQDVLTKAGAFVGTVCYSSPEQARGDSKAMGTSSDIYSLGVVLYELLTGRRPFCGDSDVETLRQICDDPPIPPTRYAATLHFDLEAVCLKCLEKEPSKRYPSCKQFGEDLDRFLAGSATRARPLRADQKVWRWVTRRPTTAALLCLSLLLVVGLLVGLVVYSSTVTTHARKLSAAVALADSQRTEAELLREQADRLRFRAQQERQRATAGERKANGLRYVSEMRLASNAWSQNRVRQTYQILSNLRGTADDSNIGGIEFNLLDRVVSQRYRPLHQFDESVGEIALMPDKRSVVILTESGTIHFWDLPESKLTRSIRAQVPISSSALAVAPDGSQIAVASKGELGVRQVLLLDSRSGELVQRVSPHLSTIESIRYSPDGKYLASGARYSGVQLWSFERNSGRMLKAARRNESIAFSPDSKWLYTARAEPPGIRIWNCASATIEREFSVPDKVHNFALSPDGKLVAVHCSLAQSVIGLHDSNTGHQLAALERTGAIARGMTFVADGGYLVAGCDDGELKSWRVDLDIMMGKCPPGNSPEYFAKHLSGFFHDGRVNSVLEFGTQAISGGADGSLAISDLVSTSGAIPPDSLHGLTVARLLAGGTQVLLGMSDGSVKLSRLRGEYPMTMLFKGDSPVTDIAVQPAGRIVAVGFRSGKVVVVDAISGDRVAEFEPENRTVAADNDQQIRSVAVDAAGLLVASAGYDNFARLWNVSTSRLEQAHHFPSDCNAVAISADGNLWGCGGDFEEVVVWRTDEDSELIRLGGLDETNYIDFSSDGSRIVSSHRDSAARIFTFNGDTPPRFLREHESVLTEVRFSSDGKRVMGIEEAGVLRIWDSTTGVELTRLDCGPRTERCWGNLSIAKENGILMIARAEASPASLVLWDLR